MKCGLGSISHTEETPQGVFYLTFLLKSFNLNQAVSCIMDILQIVSHPARRWDDKNQHPQHSYFLIKDSYNLLCKGGRRTLSTRASGNVLCRYGHKNLTKIHWRCHLVQQPHWFYLKQSPSWFLLLLVLLFCCEFKCASSSSPRFAEVLLSKNFFIESQSIFCVVYKFDRIGHIDNVSEVRWSLTCIIVLVSQVVLLVFYMVCHQAQSISAWCTKKLHWLLLRVDHYIHIYSYTKCSRLSFRICIKYRDLRFQIFMKILLTQQ